MSDAQVVLGQIQALLSGPHKSEQPKPTVVKDEQDQRSKNDTAEVDALTLENRGLKSEIERLRLELSKAERLYSADQSELNRHKQLLEQAGAALVQYQKSQTSLHTDITSHVQALEKERHQKEQMEVTMNAAKTQLSKIAREKHELVVELGKVKEGLEKMEKRAKYAEDNRNQLSHELKNLQQRQARSTGPPVANLQEKARVSELKLRTTEDQVRYLRNQNEALMIQVEANRRKESDTPTPIPDPTRILPTARDLVKRPWDLIWGLLLDNLPTIITHVPTLFRLITTLDPSSTNKYRHKRMEQDPEEGRKGTVISEWKAEIERKEKEKADNELKLITDKAALKQLVHDREKQISKIKEENDSLIIQNRAYAESFKKYERESQEISKRNKEKLARRTARSVLVPERASSRTGPADPIPKSKSKSTSRHAEREEYEIRYKRNQTPTPTLTPAPALALVPRTISPDPISVPTAPSVPVMVMPVAVSVPVQRKETAKPAHTHILTPNPKPSLPVSTPADQPREQGIPMNILARVLGKPAPTIDPFSGLDQMFGDDSRNQHGEDVLKARPEDQARHTSVEGDFEPVRSAPDESISSFMYGGRGV